MFNKYLQSRKIHLKYERLAGERKAVRVLDSFISHVEEGHGEIGIIHCEKPILLNIPII